MRNADSIAVDLPTVNPALSEFRLSPERWLVPVLAVFLGLVLLAGLGIGALSISPGQVLAILASQVGIELPWSFTEREAAVLLHIRTPRIFVGALAGAALALGGALMQALFRNPLADPGLIGVSSGAAVAAASVTVVGPAFLPALGLSPLYVMPVAAFLGGWGVTALVMRVADTAGRVRVDHLLLAGIALNAMAFAGIGVLMLIADDAQLREVAFWNFGSLGRADWSIAPLLLALVLPILWWGRRYAPWLNALLLGEGEAALLGVPVERVKRVAVLLTCVAVGATISFTGLIGFVGLVAPHIVRLLSGPDHRRLIPASALLGAALLPLADIFSRTVAAPVELPIGLVTALLGAPFFLYLLIREQRREAA
ncbi:MAG TPA: iron ABC transporter permease [Kiritimatiellia bacterium]|nr:iron ABC transporter permease [Kiritimatiellia bacterium]